MREENLFQRLNSLNVSAHIEKKGGFSYLSWPYAVAELRKADPRATWEVMRFDGKPFLQTECGYFVEVAVTVQGVTLSQIHPVLNNRNQPIPKPSSFDINTSIQRCLVKAIALHGLGLYIYAGEDLPEDEKKPQVPPDLSTAKERIKAAIGCARTEKDIEETLKIEAGFISRMPHGWQKGVADMAREKREELNANNGAGKRASG